MFAVGGFDCQLGEPSFDDTGPIHEYPIVFPRTAVTITHTGADPVVVDRNRVIFYNDGQRA